MTENTWLALPSLTSLLILLWLFLKKDKRLAIKTNWPIQMLFSALFGISLIEFATYTQLISASILSVKLFYASCFIGLTGLLSQAVKNSGRKLSGSLLLPGVLLSLCILTTATMVFTDAYVTGIEKISYSYTRVPGEYYVLIQLYLFSLCFATLAFLVSGTVNTSDRLSSAKSRVLLISISPILLFGMGLILLMQAGIKINASMAFPLFISYFLVMLTHIEKEESLLSMLMKIPFSKERQSLKQISAEVKQFIINAELARTEESGTTKTKEALRNEAQLSLKSLTGTIENLIVEHAVHISQGSQAQAASLLGISSSSICRKKRRKAQAS